MNIKKILSGVLAAAMLAQGAALAEDILLISANPQASEEDVATVEDVAIYDKVVLYGTADITEENELYIVDENEMETVINTDENTIFANAEGLKISFEEIKDGDSIKVIASSAMAQSLPPQVYGYVVMVGEALPIYVDVEKVEKDEDENTVLYSKDGTYKIVIGEETEVVPFATRNIVKAEDIKAESRILVYSNIMTMSIPAVVPAEKIVILPEAVVAEDDETEAEVAQEREAEADVAEIVEPEKIVLNGEDIDAELKNADGGYLLPVRAVCEKAGLDVAWDDTLKAVSVGTIPMGVNFSIGKNEYAKARMMPQELSSAPVLIDGLTYVPTDFFTEILGATVENADGAINVELKVNLD